MAERATSPARSDLDADLTPFAPAQEIIDKIYFTITDETPPDYFTVEGMIYWMPKVDSIEILHQVIENNLHFTEEVYKEVHLRLEKCSEAFIRGVFNSEDSPKNIEQLREYAIEQYPRFFRHEEGISNHFLSLIAMGGTPPPVDRAVKAIEAINVFWYYACEHDDELKHPIAPIVRAFIKEQENFIKEQEKRKGGHSIRDATIDQINGFTSTNYLSSEIARRQWEGIGSIDTVMVDGEPIASFIADVDNFSVGYPRVYKPKGTGDQLQLALPKGRDTMSVPITLIAYQMFGSDLRSSLVTDVALLMQIIYATNEKLILNVKDGAALLSRDIEGNPRYPRASDEKRFEKAFACLHGMAGWITDDRDIPRFYPLTACDRLSNDEVIISAPAWAQRKEGRWTLTATLGETGRPRFKGNAHNNNIKRVIDGIEYWLARDRHARVGTSQSLLPAHKNTGPGPWQTLKWDKLLMLAGDVWDIEDKQAHLRAYHRFRKIRSTLIEYGYQVPDLNRPASAGDSVEFLFGGRKDGKLQVRASERFVEAARKAQRREFSRISLNEFLRL